jgi:hypothetical protein
VYWSCPVLSKNAIIATILRCARYASGRMGDASLSRSFPVVGFSANPCKKKLAGVGVCYAESVSGVEENSRRTFLVQKTPVSFFNGNAVQ